MGRHNNLAMIGIFVPFFPPLSGSRSFDLLVKNLNGKNYTMTFNNLLKPISVEGSSRKVSVLCPLEIFGSFTKYHVWCLTLVSGDSVFTFTPSILCVKSLHSEHDSY